MTKQITGFFFGAIAPIISGIIALAMVPLYFKLFENGLLMPFLGILATMGLVTSFTLYFKPELIEKITPNFLQSKELEKGFVHGLAFTIISLICWFFGSGGNIANLL